MKRVVALFYEHEQDLYTKGAVKRALSQGTGTSVKGGNLRKIMERCLTGGIIEKLIASDGETVYRLRSKALALAYLQGHFADYAGRVAPRRPPTRPVGTVFHRANHKIVLTQGELAKVQRLGQLKRFGRTPEYYHVVTPDFNLKAWSTGKAHVFLKDDWRKGLGEVLGPLVVAKVEEDIRNGGGHEGVAIPTEKMLPDEFQGKLPVKAIYRVHSDDGRVSTFQYGYSQVEGGELDRHGPVNEPNANDVEAWLTDEAQFKAGVRNLFTMLNNKLDRLVEVQERTPETIGEAVKRAMQELMGEAKTEYQAKRQDDDNLMYG